jgi:membrane protein required for colicin V production
LIDLENFSIFDLTFAISLLISVISGFIKGFVRQLLGLAGIFGGTYCAYKLSLSLTKWWHGHFNVDAEVMKIIVFIIFALIIYILVIWLAILLGKLLKMAMLSWINRLFGMLFGAIKITLIFSALAYAIYYLQLTGMEMKDINKSVVYDYLIAIANTIFFFFEPSKNVLPMI